MGDCSNGSDWTSATNCPNASIKELVNAGRSDKQQTFGQSKQYGQNSAKQQNVISCMGGQQQTIGQNNQNGQNSAKQQNAKKCKGDQQQTSGQNMTMIKESMFGKCNQGRRIEEQISELLTKQCKGDQQTFGQNNQMSKIQQNDKKQNHVGVTSNKNLAKTNKIAKIQQNNKMLQKKSPKLRMEWNKKEDTYKYSAEEKIEIMDLAKSIGNRAAGKDFNTAESSIRYWLKMEAKIRMEAECMGSIAQHFELGKKRKAANDEENEDEPTCSAKLMKK